MKTKLRLIVICQLLSALCLSAFAQGTAFTYQGRLNDGGSPGGGIYSLTFSLFNTNTTGVSVAGPVTNNAVIVTNGLFTVLIDFGPGVFTSTNSWLDIGVETNGASLFTTLTPRQPLTPTPYAIFAESVAASGIVGTLLDSQLNHSAVTVNPGPGLSGGGRVALGNTIILTNTGVLAGALTLPAVTPGTADIIYSGGALLLYNDNNGNLFTGQNAGNSGTSGDFNTANGVYALLQNTSGSDNTANGAYALYSNTNGGDNTAVGTSALYYNTSGSGNTAVGSGALGGNTLGEYNTAVGFEALPSNTNGSDNTANGAYALFQNTSGSENTANGVSALNYNTVGSVNTANGYQALFSNTTGSDNTANGSGALYSNTGGFQNTASGESALYSNTNGSDNTVIGFQALYYNSSGSDNTAIGVNSLELLNSGSDNIALGYFAGASITTGSDNIDIGNAGFSTDTNIIRIGYAQTQTYIAGVLLPPPPVLIQTNFIDGRRYTNNYGWPLTINATTVWNTAGVVGSANESLCIEASPVVGGITNVCAISTIAASSTLHYTNHIGGFVPTNAIYWFTNLSTGSGNSATVNGGQIKYP